MTNVLSEPQFISYAYGYEYTTSAASSFGVAFDAHADVELGWTAGVSDMSQFDINYLVLNPMIFIEAISDASLKFWTP